MSVWRAMLSWLRPQSIFAGIYGGILLVIVSVGVFTYATMGFINEMRAQQYTETTATALFHVAAIALARQEPDQRDLWLQDAATLMGVPLQLVPQLPFDPSRRERERLDDGAAVIHARPDGAMNVWMRVPLPGSPLYLASELDSMGERQARAAATFLLEDISNYPGQEAVRLRTLSPFVGFDMRLVSPLEAGLDPDQLRRLSMDEIIVRYASSSSGAGPSAITVFAPSTTESGQVLRLGPVVLFEPLPLSLLVTASVLALLLITLGSYFIIHVFEVRIAVIEAAVVKIREGDLNTRVKLDSRDELSNLGDTLNQMASHIQRLIEAQRELTQAVSHELRTPLARLRFGMEMMAESDDAEERFSQLDRLDEDVTQLNQLIDEILTYAKLEHGMPELNFEQVDMVALAERLATETAALRKPARFSCEVQPGMMVRAELRYLHRVMQNLVGNALRYAAGEVLLKAWVEGDEAVLTVEDDGPGIPESDRDRVFQPFIRLDDSRTRSTGGYGLGLSIVNRIAFWFGGHMAVDASPALGGARFIMRWPLTRTS